MKMRNVLQNKKGMTLVELVIAFAVLAVITAIVVTMLVSTGHLFAEQANMASNRRIGDTILDYVCSALLYAEEIAASSDTSAVLKSGEMRHFISTDGQRAAQAGYLFRSEGTDTWDVFGKDFYNGKTIRLAMEHGAEKENVLTVRVFVLQANGDEEQQVYKNERTLAFLNNPDISAGDTAKGFAVLSK